MFPQGITYQSLLWFKLFETFITTKPTSFPVSKMWLNSSNINSCFQMIDFFRKPKLEKYWLFFFQTLFLNYVNTFVQDDKKQITFQTLQ